MQCNQHIENKESLTLCCITLGTTIMPTYPNAKQVYGVPTTYIEYANC